MSGPVVSLPADFAGSAMATVAGNFVRAVGTKLPEEITFDFGPLNFIQPAGVAFLNNLVRWLGEKGVEVSFSGLDPARQSMTQMPS